jgi:hypothetical protein
MARITTRLESTIAQQAFVTARGGWTWPSLSSDVKRRCAGWLASLFMHVAALAVLALIGYSLPEIEELPSLSSVWSPEPFPEEFLLTDLVPLTGERSLDAGGWTSGGDADDESSAGHAEAKISFTVDATDSMLSPLTLASASWSRSELVSPVGTARRSRGTGTGPGDGAGDEQGFFGIPFDLGNRIVYVVDNSLSMNHPHDSAAKTRFKRVQMEIVNSIWSMQPSQQFYVIFFNRETVAMPSKSMPYATQPAK